MEKGLDFLSKTVKCLTDLELNIIKNTKEDFLLFLQKNNNGFFSELTGERDKLARFRYLNPECIYEFRTILGICYIAFYEPSIDRLFLLGPTFTTAFNRTSAEIQLKKSGISSQSISRLIQFCERVPVIEEARLNNLALLILQHFIGNEHAIPQKKVEYLSDLHNKLRWDFTESNTQLANMRKIENRYELSNALTEAVKKGNLSLAIHLFSQYNNEVVDIKRNSNPLRNIQNYCIILNTQLRHSLEDSGVHPYRLDRLSSEIGVEIEQMNNIVQAKEFAIDTIKKYCRLVQENAYPNLKPLTNLTVTYIKEHLNENLTVKETAKILTVNADYLSSVFHSDMGTTFINFVNSERVKQAAGLLQHTNMPIGQISGSVGYNNTSYFAKQFYKVYGCSPRQYRNNG